MSEMFSAMIGALIDMPAGFDPALAGRTNRRPLSQSLALGLRRVARAVFDAR